MNAWIRLTLGELAPGRQASVLLHPYLFPSRPLFDCQLDGQTIPRPPKPPSPTNSAGGPNPRQSHYSASNHAGGPPIKICVWSHFLIGGPINFEWLWVICAMRWPLLLMQHNIIHIHNIVLWDRHYFMEYSSYIKPELWLSTRGVNHSKTTQTAQPIKSCGRPKHQAIRLQCK